MKALTAFGTLSGLLAFAWAASATSATTVYKSTDDRGVVTFSDTPPAADADAETLTIQTAEPLAPGEYQQRLEDMRNTTDRMVADRQQREAQRAQLRAASSKDDRNQAAGYQEQLYDIPQTVIYPYPVRRPYWQRPRPRHPVARPPMRPTGSSGSSNRQLMRPMVSGSSRAAQRGGTR